MNIIIALAGFVGIVASRRLFNRYEKFHLKNHFVILGIKVIFTSLVVMTFCLNAEKHTHAILILTGLFNMIVFHFIEAFSIQGKLINNRNLNA